MSGVQLLNVLVLQSFKPRRETGSSQRPGDVSQAAAVSSSRSRQPTWTQRGNRSRQAILPQHTLLRRITSPSVANMSLDPPAYISSLQNNIRARPISWEGAVRAKTITEEDLKKIKAIDKVRKEQRKQTIEADVKTYTQLLLGGDNVKSIFESAAKRTDILQYMLVLAGDLVDGMHRAIAPMSLLQYR